jgi:hypothetical protein
MAGETLNEGKSAAQLFAIQCGECHKSPRGLGKSGGSLAGFLREHYTTGRDQAEAIAGYVLGTGGGTAAPQRPGRGPQAAPAAAAAGGIDETQRRRGRNEPVAAAPAAEETQRQGRGARAATGEPAATPEDAAPPSRVAPSRLRRGKPVPSLDDAGARPGVARIPTMEEGRAPEPAGSSRTPPAGQPSQAARYEPPQAEAPSSPANPGEPRTTASATAEAGAEGAGSPAADGGGKPNSAPPSAAVKPAAPVAPGPAARPDDIPD